MEVGAYKVADLEMVFMTPLCATVGQQRDGATNNSSQSKQQPLPTGRQADR